MEKQHVVIFVETYDDMKSKADKAEEVNKTVIAQEQEIEILKNLCGQICGIALGGNNISNPRHDVCERLDAFGYKLSTDIIPKLIKL